MALFGVLGLGARFQQKVNHGYLRLVVRAVRYRPQGLLRALIMLIRTDLPALRGGTVPLSARYGRC